jgi:hypothetical protein
LRCSARARTALSSSRPMISVYPAISLNMIAASSRVWFRAGGSDEVANGVPYARSVIPLIRRRILLWRRREGDRSSARQPTGVFPYVRLGLAGLELSLAVTQTTASGRSRRDLSSIPSLSQLWTFFRVLLTRPTNGSIVICERGSGVRMTVSPPPSPRFPRSLRKHRKYRAGSRTFFDLRAPERFRFGPWQRISAGFSRSRIEPVPFAPADYCPGR